MKKMRVSTKRKYSKESRRNFRAEDNKTKLKKSLEGFIKRLDQAEERISKLKDRFLWNYRVRGLKKKKKIEKEWGKPKENT